jgi:hypothetical protein
LSNSKSLISFFYYKDIKIIYNNRYIYLYAETI